MDQVLARLWNEMSIRNTAPTKDELPVPGSRLDAVLEVAFAPATRRVKSILPSNQRSITEALALDEQPDTGPVSALYEAYPAVHGV